MLIVDILRERSRKNSEAPCLKLSTDTGPDFWPLLSPSLRPIPNRKQPQPNLVYSETFKFCEAISQISCLHSFFQLSGASSRNSIPRTWILEKCEAIIIRLHGGNLQNFYSEQHQSSRSNVKPYLCIVISSRSKALPVPGVSTRCCLYVLLLKTCTRGQCRLEG